MKIRPEKVQIYDFQGVTRVGISHGVKGKRKLTEGSHQEEFVPETFLSSCIGHAIIFTFYEIVYEAFPFYFPNLQNTSS